MDEAEGHAVHHNSKEMWKCIHRLSKYRPPVTSALRKEDRSWCHTDEEEIQAIQRYQTRELFMQDTPTAPQEFVAPETPDYTPTDVRLALRSQKPWKAVPRWASPVAAWRICEEECIELTCKVWVQSAEEGALPDSWRKEPRQTPGGTTRRFTSQSPKRTRPYQTISVQST